MAARSTRGARGRGKGRSSSRKGAASSSNWPWFAALIVVAAGISAYDHRGQLPAYVADLVGGGHGINRHTSEVDTLHAASVGEVPRPLPRAEGRAPLPPATTMTASAADPGRTVTYAPLPPATTMNNVSMPTTAQTTYTRRFYYCGRGGLRNCVVDGDTFWLDKVKIRVADIDAPETEQAKCKSERDRGYAAKVRLRELLNAGAFSLAAYGHENKDIYGRSVRLVMRNGQSLGAILVKEGLARPWTGHRKPWC
ncbi:thermonuclease family protein [Allorhizobium sp. BGMRC 0089]|uniref:thermonuclease family protein n=1 Tax=Allorhizobium sonneratiae TaxID=2934936 RepID=UPI002034604C|nr:thermonuclease family protein [Allorhizobium sonneratiae]MCM2294158.1 thermonuclease family protein [Allorhizobium sonneratiae]